MISTWATRGGQTARDFSAAAPLVNVALTGSARLTATMSVTPRPCVSLRRHGQIDVTLGRLIAARHDRRARWRRSSLLRCRSRCNIIVTGGVNAGKTTLLRALASEIPPGERVATLESEYELYLHELPQHPDVIAFEAREPNSEGAGGITLHDLIAHALRHNPRRILVGEVRRGEIMPMLEAMNSGQEGSMCTLHANSPAEAFDRILILGLRGGLALAERAIHILVGMAVDLIVHVRTRLRRHPDGAVRLGDPRGDAARRHRAAGRQPAVPARSADRPGDGGAHAVAAAARPARGGRLRPRPARPAAVAAARVRPQRRQPGSGRGDRCWPALPAAWRSPAWLCSLLELTRPAPAPGAPPRGMASPSASAVAQAPADRRLVPALVDARAHPVAGRDARGRAGRALPARLTSSRAAQQPGRGAGGPGAVDPPAVRHADRQPRPGGGARGIGAAGARGDRAGRRRARPAGWRRAPGTEAALRAFAADIDDPAGDRIAAALIIATGHRGGAVRDVLNALAVMLARDVAARREIEAERAQHRTTVKWMTLFVLGFTVFAVLNRSYSAPYGTVPGQVVLALVAALYAGGLLLAAPPRLACPAPGRFLAPAAARACRPRAPDAGVTGRWSAAMSVWLIAAGLLAASAAGWSSAS